MQEKPSEEKIVCVYACVRLLFDPLLDNPAIEEHSDWTQIKNVWKKIGKKEGRKENRLLGLAHIGHLLNHYLLFDHELTSFNWK